VKTKCTIFYLVVGGLLALLACNNIKDTSKNSNWSIELKKGGCLEACSSYSILVNTDGSYNYKGNYQVKHQGKKTGKLTQAYLTQLDQLVHSIDWNSLKNSYGNDGDTQRKELNYTSNTTNKQVVYYRLEPQKIRQLEHFIDTIVNHDEF